MNSKGYYIFPFDKVNKGSKIVIYGAGEIGNDFINQIEKTKFCEVVCLIDQNYKSINNIGNYKVVSVDTLKKKEFDSIVIASIKYKKEILSILSQFKIESQRIICCEDNYIPYLDNLGKLINIDLRELFMQQHSNGKFNRMDIIVRLLAIENYYNLNDYGFNLYNKMQLKRNVIKTHNLNRFKNLIQEVENNDMLEKPIVCDQRLSLVDGSHRFSLAIFYNKKRLLVNIDNHVNQCDYSIDWFLENGFTQDEIEKIINKYEEIYKRFNIPFFCILWPPVSQYFKEITEQLKNEYDVLEIKDFICNEDEFERIINGIYAIDDIEGWKIDKKLSYIKPYPEKKIRTIEFNIPEPSFRLKVSNNKTISEQVEKIKKRIRDLYKEKLDNYFYDIIIHIGDNYTHSEHIKSILKKDIMVNEFLESISNNYYALIKTDVPYYPSSFPFDYCLGKDIDLICAKKEFDRIVSKAISFAESYKEKYSINIINNDCQIKIRFEINNFMCLQLDISSKIDGLKNSFIEDAINNRISRNYYYILNNKYEFIIRLNEFLKNSFKMHHRDYLIENLNDFDEETVSHYLEKHCNSNDIGNLLY